MKAKTKGKPAKPNPDAVPVAMAPGDDAAARIAQTYLRPTVQAACTVRAYNKVANGDGPELQALVTELGAQAKAAQGGDLGRAEAMLLAQAHTLDSIFGNLARRAVVQEHLLQYETHLRLALKAQSQCRATLETLATIKNPAPVAFVRQANIGQAVQVNNGTAPPSRAGELENPQSKLLETQDGERLDTGATGAASAPDSHLATVGAIHRP